MFISPLGSIGLSKAYIAFYHANHSGSSEDIRINRAGLGTPPQSNSVSEGPEQDYTCDTCGRRRYICSSGTTENISPETSFIQVALHEKRHLEEARSEARQKGMRVIYQNIQIHISVCPECGRPYASGGTATTKMVPDSFLSFNQGLSEPTDVDPSETELGQRFDRYM